MIDVLVPVLSRPQNAQPLVDTFRATAPQGARLHFICTRGDDAQIEACRRAGAIVHEVDWPAAHADYARKINYGATHSGGGNEFVLNASDDIEFTEGWAEKALGMMSGRRSVVATNDDLNGQVKSGLFGTHCITRRSYILEQGATADGVPGLLLHEGYDHNYVDRELCSVARQRGVYAFCRDSIIRHRHPLFRTARWDATYRKSVARFREDRDLYLSRAALYGDAGLTQAEKNLVRRQRRDIVRR
jgi:hypothetical protein